MNHFKDEEENFEHTKLLARFINPQAAAEVFDHKTVEKTESTPDVLFDDIAKDLKGKYSAEELEIMLEDPEHYEGLDKIERVE